MTIFLHKHPSTEEQHLQEIYQKGFGGELSVKSIQPSVFK